MDVKTLLRNRTERFIALVEQDAPDDLKLNELGMISQAYGMLLGTHSLRDALNFQLPSAQDRIRVAEDNG